MARPKVLIAERLASAPADWLGQRAELIWADSEPAVLEQNLPEAEALIVRTYTQVTAELLDQAPKLKVIGRAGVGLDNVDVPACRERRIEVVYTPNANTQAVVEYVFSLMFDAYRPRVALDVPTQAEQFHELRQAHVGRQVEELTLGIVGFGRIGRRVGEVAYALGMNLIACDIQPESQMRKR